MRFSETFQGMEDVDESEGFPVPIEAHILTQCVAFCNYRDKNMAIEARDNEFVRTNLNNLVYILNAAHFLCIHILKEFCMSALSTYIANNSFEKVRQFLRVRAFTPEEEAKFLADAQVKSTNE